MTRWKQIESIFEQALDLPTEERAAFLQRTCNRDEELRREVESLLVSHAKAGSFIDDRRQFQQEFDSRDSRTPQLIGHYRIVRELGRGGMGAVYLAERADEYKKQVAIKLIKRGMDTDSVLRHFRNERQILAGFDHPNIARLFDGGTTDDGLPYFVMEYIEGLPIDEYCNTHALSIPDRLKLFRQVCAAVSYAHRHLVIHRDIKRSNILVTAEGVPKLLDFGIAKILQTGEGAPTFATMTGLRLMTPEYASPEQVLGQPVTTATDVYSLGVILYELLTGQFPYRFARQTPRDIEHAITHTPPTRPSTALKDRNSRIENRESTDSPFTIYDSRPLRGDLDNIVLKALRKEPERRYQSVEQFSEDVRRHLGARPVHARKDTFGYRSAKFMRRNKLPLAAAAIVLLALVGGIITTTWEKARAERRFNDVRKLANSVLFDYHDAIKDLPGATKVRERLVKDALNYLDSLAGEAQGDPALQRELAAAYERVGDVRGGSESGSLGDVPGAMESYAKALQIRKALVTLNTNDTQARINLARNYQKIAYRLLEADDLQTALKHLQTAVAICLDLTRERPDDEDFQFELARARNTLGDGMAWHSDLTAALEQHRAALAICDKLLAGHPKDSKYRRELWATHDFIAYALSMQDDTAGAIEANRKALAVVEALIADDPINADYRRTLVQTYQHAGNYREKTDKPGALAYFRKAAAADEELIAMDPANALTRKDLAYTHKKIGDFLVRLDDNGQALLHFSKALESYQKVVVDAPADLISSFLVVTCQGGVARMQARLGEVDPALEECRKAAAFLQKITADKPGELAKAQACEYLGYAYTDLAKSSKASDERRKRLSAARNFFQQALHILDDARALQTTLGPNEQWAKEIAAEVAKCDAALAKP